MSKKKMYTRTIITLGKKNPRRWYVVRKNGRFHDMQSIGRSSRMDQRKKHTGSDRKR